MRILVKDENNNVMILNSVNGFIPTGYSIVPEEEINAEEILLARKDKMAEIRAKRDTMMLVHDKLYLIALKDSASTVNLLTDRTALLDLPENAQTAIDLLETVEDIKAYDAFATLNLSQSYE